MPSRCALCASTEIAVPNSAARASAAVGQLTSAVMAKASKFGSHKGAEFGLFDGSGSAVRLGESDEFHEALIDLARVRQHQHVGERLAFAKTAARLSFFDDIVKRMLTERQMQAQLLAGDAERSEHVRVANRRLSFRAP